MLLLFILGSLKCSLKITIEVISDGFTLEKKKRDFSLECFMTSLISILSLRYNVQVFSQKRVSLKSATSGM